MGDGNGGFPFITLRKSIIGMKDAALKDRVSILI